MRIFVVEDDTDIREMISYALQISGYEVAQFADSLSFYEGIEEETPCLILLDIMIPYDNGLIVLKNLKSSERTKGIPVIMVTAKASEVDKVKGLDMGADDYITKPFGVLELVSRVRAVLRRVEPSGESDILSFGDILLDDNKHTVEAGGEICELTFKEYELLKYLLLNQEIVLSREKLLQNVWGFEFEGETRTVDMHIKTLRQKLGKRGGHIKTVRNVGYKIGV